MSRLQQIKAGSPAWYAGRVSAPPHPPRLWPATVSVRQRQRPRYRHLVETVVALLCIAVLAAAALAVAAAAAISLLDKTDHPRLRAEVRALVAGPSYLADTRQVMREMDEIAAPWPAD